MKIKNEKMEGKMMNNSNEQKADPNGRSFRKVENEKSEKKKKRKGSWAVKVTVITFFISLIISFFSDILSKNLSFFLALLILLIIILIGIVFDILGLAIATADEKVFNAMAAKKIKGSKEALYLIKNVEKLTNICNDVVGDIAGIISGATGGTIGLYIVLVLKESGTTAEIMILSVVSAIIAALTVGGKALGKKFAIMKANDVVFFVSRIMSFLKFVR